LAFSGIFAFSRVPLKLATFLGALTILGGIGYAIFVLLAQLFGGSPRGFATLALLEVTFSGVLLLVLGVIGEYVGRIYDEVKHRPLYIVNRVWEARRDG
jgi:dolichol-phosphate mannosyltransferase